MKNKAAVYLGRKSAAKRRELMGEEAYIKWLSENSKKGAAVRRKGPVDKLLDPNGWYDNLST